MVIEQGPQKHPRVIVAHPGTQHSFQAALACQEAGILRWYVTGAYYKPNEFPYTLVNRLPAKLKSMAIRELKRRFCPDLDSSKVKTYSFWEWAGIVSGRIPGLRRLGYPLVRKRNRRVSIQVGRVAAREADILLGWFSASLESFCLARPAGVICVLDQSIGHIQSLSDMLQEEVGLHPELAGGFNRWYSPEEVERQSRELELADAVLVGSEFVRQTLIKNGVWEGKIHLLPYGVDTVRFSPRPKKLERDVFRMLFVGGINMRKGTLYLLEAVRQLLLPRAELILVGPNDLPASILARYQGYFTPVPYVRNHEIHQLYQQADVYVFPSLFEGSSLSIYEAMASGLPVITTPNSGSVVRDGIDGFIVPIRDVQALKEKILLLYENKELREQMGVKAREQAEKYSWQVYRNNLAGFLTGLPNNGMGRR